MTRAGFSQFGLISRAARLVGGSEHLLLVAVIGHEEQANQRAAPPLQAVGENSGS